MVQYEILPTLTELTGSVAACAIWNSYPTVPLNTITDLSPRLELTYHAEKHNLGTVKEINNNHYRAILTTLSNGGVVISAGYIIGQLRDGFGYCTSERLSNDWIFYRGYIDASKRPAVICQNVINVDYPRGNAKLVTPSLTKYILPLGAYLLDAETVETLAPTLYCL